MINEKQEQLAISLIEETWPSYHVERRIGSGGFGAVYQLKKNTGTGRDRAVKIIYSDNDESLDRKTENEITLQYDYEDINEIVNILDSRVEVLEGNKKFHMIELELMDGSVADMIRESGALEPKEAVRIMISVCKALRAMERHSGTRAVHGDIKPANILYKIRSFDGKRIFKLSDFGCVYDLDQTRSSWAGTEKYTIPGDWSETRDEYAMGISLMEMLGAAPPTMVEKISGNLLWEKLPDSLKIPEAIIEICRKAAALQPKKRYQTASEMQDALENWLQETEMEEQRRKQALAHVKELLSKIEHEHDPAEMERALSEAEKILNELHLTATEDEMPEIEEDLRKIQNLRASLADAIAYEKAGALAESGDLIAALKSISIFASIHNYKDSADRIRAAAQFAENEAARIIQERDGYKEKSAEAFSKKLEAEERLKKSEKQKVEIEERLKKSEAALTAQPGNPVQSPSGSRPAVEFADFLSRNPVQNNPWNKGAGKFAPFIEFGRYPQNADGKDNTPIRWKVLAVEDSKALLISEKALEAKAYNPIRGDVTWQKCSLRKWLNKEFLKTAFSEDEVSKIKTVFSTNRDNPMYGTSGGISTEDRIFLLSLDEAEKYFADNESRKCSVTEYVRENEPFAAANDCNWWLRSPGSDSYRAAVVTNGSINAMGKLANVEGNMVRPALWLKI